MTLRFGTSGWQAVTADEFTFAGVRSVTSAMCSHFEASKQVGGLMVVGYGTRFLGEQFAEESANVISENAFRALLCSEPVPTPTISYVVRTNGSVATSHLVDRVAEVRGLPVYETPVGFKYIGELINENKIVIGGEKSAGLSIKGHYPEKDGILACLLAAETVAARGASLTEQLHLYGESASLRRAELASA